MARLRRLAAALLVAAITGAVGAGASHALFDGGSANPGNVVSAGTVSISDNDSGDAMFDLSGMRPADPPETRCIRVSYDGDLNAVVRLYGSSSGGLAPHLSVKVERGEDASPSFSSCAGFTPDSTMYDGTLAAYPGSFSTGLVDGAPETWTEGEVHSYRFTVDLANAPAAQGLTSEASFTWEARDS